jgi:hypothetical protein
VPPTLAANLRPPPPLARASAAGQDSRLPPYELAVPRHRLPRAAPGRMRMVEGPEMVRRRAVDHGSAVRGGLRESGVARGGGRPHRREREMGAGDFELQQGEPATRVEAGPSLRGCLRPAHLACRRCEAALLHWQPMTFLLGNEFPADAPLRRDSAPSLPSSGGHRDPT